MLEKFFSAKNSELAKGFLEITLAGSILVAGLGSLIYLESQKNLSKSSDKPAVNYKEEKNYK